MRLFSLRRSLLLILTAAFLTASACQPEQSPPGAAKTTRGQEITRERVVGSRGGLITYRVVSSPKTFNYLMAADADTLLASFVLTGGRLVELDHDTQRYVPGLAESWRLGDDGRTLELTLRDGLKFSDGRALVADDVLFTFRAIYDEKLASPLFRDAMTIGGRQIEASATSARRVLLVFPEAIATPENYLSNVAVLPRHLLEEDLKRGTLRDAWNVTADPKLIATSGAFTPEAVVPGERVTLKRNPHYWKKDGAGTGLPYLDSIIIEVAPDANNAVTRLGQNSLDIVDRIRPTDYASFRKQQEAASVRAYDLGPGLITDHIVFNLNESGQAGKGAGDPVKRAWFGDARFRRAVSHAIDRDSIASSTLQGLATPLYGFISPGNRAWAAPDLPRAGYDLERARALLTEAGFTLRSTQDAPELYDPKGNRVEFTLIVPAEHQPRVDMATVIQEDLARLGIRMQVAPIELGQLSSRLKQSFDYDAALFGTSVTEPDPSSYTNFLSSSGAEHQWRPKQTSPATEWEARVDDLVARQARETDATRRGSIFREAQVIIAEQLPVVPVVARHIASAANARVGNYRPSTIFPYSLWNAEELFVRK